MTDETEKEIFIMQVKHGDQSPVVEQGLEILGQTHDKLGWFTSERTRPVFLTSEDGSSGQWMLPVWTRMIEKHMPASDQLSQAVLALCTAVNNFAYAQLGTHWEESAPIELVEALDDARDAARRMPRANEVETPEHARIRLLEDTIRVLCYAIIKHRKDTRAEDALHSVELVGWQVLNEQIAHALKSNVFGDQK